MDKFIGSFDGLACTEIIRGDEFLFENQVTSNSGIPFNVEEKIIKKLANLMPIWSQNSQKVSLVILAGGNNGFLLNLLDSILTSNTKYFLEILIIPYYGKVDHENYLSQIPWVKLVHTTDTLKIIDSSSSANLIFVTQYERIVEGCIDELMGSFSLDEKIATVGVKLLNHNYQLLEAGGLCFEDTGPESVGKGENPNSTEFCFARAVNFYSGCFAVKKEILSKFYLDKNINCFLSLFHAVQVEGLINYYQPMAKTVAFTDLYLHLSNNFGSQRNREIDSTRINWPMFYAHSKKECKYIGRPPKGHLLFIDFFIPDPTMDAGSGVVTKLMRAFINNGWRVSLFPTHLNAYNHRLVANLARIGVEVLHSSQYKDLSAITEKYCDQINFIFAVRVVVLAPLLHSLKTYYQKAPIAFYNCDLYYLRMKREALLNDDMGMMFESALTKIEELKCIREAHCSIVHTRAEAEVIKSDFANAKNIVELPFVTETIESNGEISNRRNIMFLGGYEHTPNVDAVTYFVENIWSKIRQFLPSGAKLILAGSKPSAKVTALGSDDVIVTGHIKNLKPYFEESRIFIAPLRYGAGVKGKVITAMAHGVPVVATSIAIEGINVQADRHLLHADDDEEFGNKLLQLYNDESLWKSLRAHGYDYVKNNASEAAYSLICENIVKISQLEWLSRMNEAIDEELNRHQ
jgi:glycosyltransferase involved in cell wall biosynthesis